MNLSSNREPSIDLPVPEHSLADMIRIWLGLLGTPSAWAIQVFLSEPFAAYACYPHRAPLPEPIWGSLPTILMAVSFGCLALALLSVFAAWHSWQRYGKERAVKAGEDRNRFLIKLSIPANFIFMIAILFNIFAVLLVPPC